VSGGECKIKEPPPHVILGKTQVDQDWIDGEVEVGVGVCGFPRPGPRPAALDAPPATRQVIADPVPASKPKKKGFIRRFRERVLRAPPVAVKQVPTPIPYTAAPVPAPTPVPAPMPPRRDPVLDFLTPKGQDRHG
jgi:hypothetical protein